MTNSEFQIWLSGFFELEKNDATLNAKQLWIINNHLNLVETVSGQLDDANQWLKQRLKVFSSQVSNHAGLFNEFQKITQQIKRWLKDIETVNK